MRRRRANLMSAKKDTKLGDVFKFYLEDLELRNTSPRTIRTYKAHIEQFMEVTETIDYPAGFVNNDTWLFYLDEMKNDNRKNDRTVGSYCRSIRAFLYWSMDNDYIVPTDLKMPKETKYIKRTYTDEEVSRLLSPPNTKKCSEVQYQTWVFINLIMATGLRLSSALSLKVSDYVSQEGILYVQETKQRRGQQLFINKNMCSILNQYIRQFELEEDDYIFCTANLTPLNIRSMQENVARFNKSREVSKTSIHLMRHTFAKNYYLTTKDIYGLSQILGHSDIQTTEKYLKDLGLTKEAGIAYNPQEKFKQEEVSKPRRRGNLHMKK